MTETETYAHTRSRSLFFKRICFDELVFFSILDMFMLICPNIALHCNKHYRNFGITPELFRFLIENYRWRENGLL